jgi:hypothetical protein
MCPYEYVSILCCRLILCIHIFCLKLNCCILSTLFSIYSKHIMNNMINFFWSLIINVNVFVASLVRFIVFRIILRTTWGSLDWHYYQSMNPYVQCKYNKKQIYKHIWKRRAMSMTNSFVITLYIMSCGMSKHLILYTKSLIDANYLWKLRYEGYFNLYSDLIPVVGCLNRGSYWIT